MVGSASACRDIARPRIQVIVDKFTTVITQFSSSAAERADLTQLLDRNIADGRSAVTSGRMDCRLAERQLADLEQSIARPPLPAAAPPSVAVAPSFAAAAATAPSAAVSVGPPVRGITDREIRFGISAAFTGAAKELGRQMKLGIDAAFNRVNEAGGVEGRTLKLIGADDGNEPKRTAENMKQLYEKDEVFGIIGNVGTPTAAVAVPYALERRMLFFAAFTGAPVVRHDPPDRYVFNYRSSYAGVGGTALADELLLLGPRYASGVVVTQVVPAVSGYSSLVLDYKNSLAKYFPGEAADYVSLEGFISANILIEALKRTGPQLDTEKLIDVLENMRNLDLGLGVPLNFGRAEHQASHKIWGTAIDENGKYQAIELE
jgi:ABC-type branched-subunit amino acid transport system substrate-binding protein